MLAGTVILATVATTAGYAVQPEPPMIEYRETVSAGDIFGTYAIVFPVVGKICKNLYGEQRGRTIFPNRDKFNPGKKSLLK